MPPLTAASMPERTSRDTAPSPRRDKSPYFLQPAKGGGVTVFRRPGGNRAVPKECGTLPSQSLATALMRQLQRAETVLSDLFLEATDDGIEALEAVLAACLSSVQQRAADGRLHPSRPGPRSHPPRRR